MILCPACGNANRPEARFCRMCGRKLSVECPHCRSLVGLEDLFCDQCGARLVQVEEPQQKPFASPVPQNYTPRHLAEKILKGRSKIQGEKKNVTVLFADVAGYTDIAEQVGPEKSHAILAGCFDILTACVHHFEGTVNQYTGDGIMALFGAPIAHEDHASRALESVLLMKDRLETYGGTLREKEKIAFAMRFGINTGPVVVGAIGDDLRLDYTAVGDTTNQAARLQQMAEPGRILVSESTERLVRGLFTFRPMGLFTLKGKAAPVNIFELLAQGRIKTRLQAQELRGLSPFQGRKKAWSLLNLLVESAQKGTGRTISITGQAGIGKSRLLMEALRPVTHADRFECHCARFARNIPYYPFFEWFKAKDTLSNDSAVNDSEGKKDSSGPGTEDLEISELGVACRGLLAPDPSDRTLIPLPSIEAKDRIIETMKRFFLAHSRGKPVILIVEDMHWIDRYSEEFLLHFVDSMRQQNVLLVTLHRPDYQPPWEDRSHYDRLNLAGLSETEGLALVHSLTGDLPIPETELDKIVQTANGNPFFIEELTRLMIEREAATGSRGFFELDIPDSIQDLISARIDHLEEKEKRILQAAAVLGEDPPYSVLAHMLGDMDGLKEGLQNLQARELIFEKTLFPESEYGFTNKLIQEVAYHGILEGHRAELHHQAGHAIETAYADDLSTRYGLLAFHFTQSRDEASALKYLRLAAVRAYSVYAHKEATEKFEQALELADRQGEGAEALASRIDIRLDYGAQLMRLKGRTGRDFRDLMKEAERLSLLLQDKERETAVKMLVSGYQILEGLFSEAEKGIAEVIAFCEETGRKEQLASALRLLHHCTFHKGELAPALRSGRRQLELQEKHGFIDPSSSHHLESYINTCGSVAILLFLEGKRHEAWRMFDKGRQAAERAKDPALRGYVLADQGQLLLMEGASEEGARCVRESLHVHEKLGLTVFLPALHMLHGIVLIMTEEWEAGRRNIALGYRESVENQILFTFFWYGILATGMLEMTNPGDPLAREIREKLAEMTVSIGTPYYKSMFKHLEGELLIAGDPSAAEQKLDESLYEFRDLGIHYMVAHVHASLASCQENLGRHREAEASLGKAKALYEGMGFSALMDLFETKWKSR